MMWLFDAVQRAEARVQFVKVDGWRLWHTFVHTVLTWVAIWYTSHCLSRTWTALDVVVLLGIVWEDWALELFPHIRTRRGRGEDSVSV